VAAGAVLLRCLERGQSPVGPVGVAKAHPRLVVPQINEIGHLTGKQTIGELAENAEIIQMLTSLCVDYAQGCGVAQPQRVVKSAVA
jgi:EAL domain-containing protein (putative c-di-GMP-specific phosphodiesterase class I)